MSEVGASTLWGEWVLGDLADSVRLIADALGPSAQVASIQVSVPRSGDPADSVPTIRVTSRGELQHRRLCQAVTHGEHTVDEVFEPTATHWSGFVGGVYLVLMVEEVV